MPDVLGRSVLFFVEAPTHKQFPVHGQLENPSRRLRDACAALHYLACCDSTLETMLRKSKVALCVSTCLSSALMQQGMYHRPPSVQESFESMRHTWFTFQKISQNLFTHACSHTRTQTERGHTSPLIGFHTTYSLTILVPEPTGCKEERNVPVCLSMLSLTKSFSIAYLK